MKGLFFILISIARLYNVIFLINDNDPSIPDKNRINWLEKLPKKIQNKIASDLNFPTTQHAIMHSLDNKNKITCVDKAVTILPIPGPQEPEKTLQNYFYKKGITKLLKHADSFD